MGEGSQLPRVIYVLRERESLPQKPAEQRDSIYDAAQGRRASSLCRDSRM